MGSGTTKVAMAYDEAGNVVQVTRQVGNGSPAVDLARTFDALNRMTALTDADGNTIRYTYDATGNLSKLQYPDGKVVTYSYDKGNRLVSLKDWAGRTTQYTYDIHGKVSRIQFPNGTLRTNEYEPGGRIIHQRDLTPQGAIIAEYRYIYDGAGLITGEGASSAQAAPIAASMTYAKDNRLDTYNGQTVSYDRDGNLTRGPLERGTTDFSYDEDNNLVRAGTVSYGYDSEDRLTSVTSAGGTTRFAVSPGPGMSRILVSRAADGTVTRYVYGMGLLYEEVDGALRVHHYDLRGNTVALTGDNGTVTGTVAYSPFGAAVKRNGETTTLFLFGGQDGVLTDANGLIYMRFRWYSPVMRRFLSPDAHFGDISRLASLNGYSYGFSNPVNLTDPSGQFAGILIGAAIGALVGVAADLAARGIDAAVHHKPFVKKGEEWSFVGELAGAALSGAILGGAIGACGPCAASLPTAVGVGFLAGAAAGAAGNALKQGIRIGGNHFFNHDEDVQFNWDDFALQTALGAIAGAIPIARGAGAIEEELLANGEKTLAREAGSEATARELGAAEGAAIAVAEKLADLLVETAEHLSHHTVEGASEGSGDNAGDQQSEHSVTAAGRNEVYAGKKASFGEYAHFRFYENMLRLAGRALPADPHPLLASF
jgi:RHS repeat-associated protein